MKRNINSKQVRANSFEIGLFLSHFKRVCTVYALVMIETRFKNILFIYTKHVVSTFLMQNFVAAKCILCTYKYNYYERVPYYLGFETVILLRKQISV